MTELGNEFAKECKELGVSGQGSFRQEIIGLARAREQPETSDKSLQDAAMSRYEPVSMKCSMKRLLATCNVNANLQLEI